MIQTLILYLATGAGFFLLIPILYLFHAFTITRVLVLLFILDTILTLEAAGAGDIVAIAALHIITIPALLILLYLDIVQHHKNQFGCFLCGKEIAYDEEIQTVKRTILGKPTDVNVHTRCVKPGERKAISERTFRRGIPE